MPRMSYFSGTFLKKLCRSHDHRPSNKPEPLYNDFEIYGIRGVLLKLLESYLSDRQQCVSVLGEVSDKLPVVYGVPQGSCLGPR